MIQEARLQPSSDIILSNPNVKKFLNSTNIVFNELQTYKGMIGLEKSPKISGE